MAETEQAPAAMTGALDALSESLAVAEPAPAPVAVPADDIINAKEQIEAMKEVMEDQSMSTEPVVCELPCQTQLSTMDLPTDMMTNGHAASEAPMESMMNGHIAAEVARWRA